MAERNEIYTAADFERYYCGVMPFHEMHKLEMAALEDPFLADALEGYANTTSFENDIAALRARMAENKKETKRLFNTSLAAIGWWRIAALFILIAGGGYLFYKLNYTNREHTLADSGRQSKVRKKDSALVNEDTAATTNTTAFENHSSTNGEEKKRSALLKIKLQSENQFGNDKTVSDSLRFNSLAGKYGPPAFSSHSLNGKVPDQNGQPLAKAKVTNKGKMETAGPDTIDRFSLLSMDSNATSKVSETENGTKNAALRKDRETLIALDENNSKGDQAGVSGYSQSKKLGDTISASRALNSKVAGIGTTNQTVSSLRDNEGFNHYLQENLKPLYDAGKNKLTGEVILSFTINKRGRPRNVQVIHSSCDQCEREAIRLLKSGPDWMNKKQERATVLIKF